MASQGAVVAHPSVRPETVGEKWRRKARWNGYGDPPIQLSDFCRDDEAETDITVAFTYSPGCAAQTYGPPEKCWPEEPAEVEIQAAFTETEELELTPAEHERIRLWLIENPPEEEF